AMMKLVERLEAMERKMDQVLSRVSNLPSEIRNAVQPISSSQPSHHVPSSPLPHLNQGPRERILHQAVCADCRKRCEVPFKPSGDRPVYCPECFAIRKAGHVPKDITSGIVVPAHVRELKTPPPAASKRKKPAPKASKKAAKKKK
ncbi:MAG: CxxC-x17-CxxC domain-containing protein, partial [Candidatus Omnitrophota bacterium]